MRVKAKLAVPSIPARKTATNSYTGRRTNSVGPNVYSPVHDMVKKTELTSDFGSSNVNRKLHEPQNRQHNTLTARENPGPGTYDENEINAVKNKQFNAEGKNSIFLSKVPNCKDAIVVKPRQDFPGPGTYKTEVRKLNTAAGGRNHGDKDSTMESFYGSGGAQINATSPFMSTTDRAEFWSHELNAPYTK